jgi:hypothetical protein
LNACLRGSAVTNGGYTGALKTACSDQERVKMHNEKREKREYGQKIGKKGSLMWWTGEENEGRCQYKKWGKRKEMKREQQGAALIYVISNYHFQINSFRV